MKKHTVGGIEKPDDEQEENCDSCNNGKDFKLDSPLRTQMFQGKYNESICGTCISKYYQKRTDADKLIGPECLNCTYQGEHKCDNDDINFLCPGNEKNQGLKMVKIFMEGYEKMRNNLDFMADEQTFKETGECSNHHWIRAHPCKTYEGTFVFHSCLICKTGRVNYKGKIYEDDLMKLVGWVAHNGIIADGADKIKEEYFSDIIKTETKEVNVVDLFKAEMKSPVDIFKEALK